MNRLLRKIFSHSFGLGRFILSGIAFLIGLTMVMLSVQFYYQISSFLSPKQPVSDYIILNKEVGIGHTLLGGKAKFSEEDVKDLEQQNFIEDVGKFQTNLFGVELYFQKMKFTDLFLESVPTKFLEEKPSNFRWNENQDYVPLIISEDFLNLYNFAFAVGAGMPQVSKSTVGLVPLRIDIAGPGGYKSMDAKVVGFSERINSVLVPESFLTWANKNIAKKPDADISRVIIQVKSKQSGNLEAYMAEKGLKVSEDKIKFNRVATVFNIVITILFIVGVAFIVFSLVIVVMNFALTIYESKDELKLLMQLGYKRFYIFRFLIGYLLAFIITCTFFSTIAFFVGSSKIAEFLSAHGIAVSGESFSEAWIAMKVFVGLSTIISAISIARVLWKQSRV